MVIYSAGRPSALYPSPVDTTDDRSVNSGVYLVSWVMLVEYLLDDPFLNVWIVAEAMFRYSDKVLSVHPDQLCTVESAGVILSEWFLLHTLYYTFRCIYLSVYVYKIIYDTGSTVSIS